jgi:hypothetical protein
MKILAKGPRRRAPPAIIFRASLINFELAAAVIFETLDCRNVAHGNQPKAARLAGFAISDLLSETVPKGSMCVLSYQKTSGFCSFISRHGGYTAINFRWTQELRRTPKMHDIIKPQRATDCREPTFLNLRFRLEADFRSLILSRRPVRPITPTTL